MAETAPDGSPVELYALLPERGEGELVAAAVPEAATILELGCGTGRMTRQLVSRGYRITAVDESAAMLAHVRDAETVCASIEGLELGRRFDAALLASNLVNTPDAGRRQAFLETCVRHASAVVVEMLPLGWQPRDGRESRLGDVVGRLGVDRFEQGVVEGRVDYAAAAGRWTHEFSMRVFADERELEESLSAAGLSVGQWLDRTRGWLVATAKTDT